MEENKTTKFEKYINLIHIAIIVVGALFIFAGAMHENIWFDETYTVGLVKQNFINLINAGAADVHPLAYYILAKFATMPFENSIISLRIFSCIGMIMLSVLGYTHLRKDFGKKCGIIYSFLTMFTPIMLIYSGEIRMYSWAAVFVTLTGIYAYRIATKDKNIKNWILFGVFSLLSAYTHYFAMIAIGIINIVLFVWCIKNKKYVKEFLITGFSQVALFIPGLIIFIKQATRVAGGFWINITYPNILLDILTFNYTGMIDSDAVKSLILVFASVCLGYVLCNINKKREQDKNITACIFAFVVYFGVIAISLFASIKTDIFTTRYTIPMVGLFVFAVSYILSLENKKWIHIGFTTVILVLYAINAFNLYQENYSSSNKLLTETIDAKVEANDIFIYKEIGVGSILAVKYPNNKQYFYNYNHWNVADAYKAYAPQMETIEDLTKLDGVTGRIWVVDDGSISLYNELKEDSKYKVIDEAKKIESKYKGLNFGVSILEKIQ